MARSESAAERSSALHALGNIGQALVDRRSSGISINTGTPGEPIFAKARAAAALVIGPQHLRRVAGAMAHSAQRIGRPLGTYGPARLSQGRC
jgi:hypothetical protein